MKITESLKNVYTAMGGADAFNEKDIAEGINQISEVAGSGGGGSGAGFVFVTINQSEMTLNASYNDIKAILDGGTIPCIRMYDPTDGYNLLYLARAYGESHYYQAEFFNVTKGSQSQPSSLVLKCTSQFADTNMSLEM